MTEGRFDDENRRESYANLETLGSEIMEETGETGGIDSKKSLTKLHQGNNDTRSPVAITPVPNLQQLITHENYFIERNYTTIRNEHRVEGISEDSTELHELMLKD